MAAITFDAVQKTFARNGTGVVAVERIDLVIAGQEFVAIVGPSGCGKTTCLRMVAGFIEPSSGSVRLGDRAVASVTRRFGRAVSRRSFLVRAAGFGSALFVNPLRYLLRPGSAYASLCGPDASCSSGWTAFCCTVNGGQNTCPPGSMPAGWWKADNSSFCNSGPRYYIDCNSSCGTCGCGGSGVPTPAAGPAGRRR